MKITHPKDFYAGLMFFAVGLFAMVVRRLFRRRQKDLNVGNVSEDWLAQQRGSGDTTPW